jgi:acyl carrier protein
MTLEDNTGKTIPDDMVSDIKTVGDLVEVLKKL